MKYDQLLLQRTAVDWPTKIAFRGATWELTYREAALRVNRYVEHLRQNSFQDGDRLGIISQNSLNVIFLMLAAQRIGVSVVPLNIRMVWKDWQRQLELANCKLVLASALFLEGAKKTGIPVRELSEFCRNLVAEEDGEIEVLTVDPDKEFCLIFTTGSRGAPKGVLLTNQNIHASAIASNLHTGLAASDSWLLSLPLYHVGGLGIVFRSLLAGATVYVPNGFSAEETTQLVDDRIVSHISVVPTTLEELVKLRKGEKFPKSLQMILVGGAASNQKALEAAVQLEAPLFTSYGMTELSSTASCTGKNIGLESLGSAGKPLPGVQICVVDANDQDCEVEQEGRILVKGPTVFESYLLPDIGKKKREEDWFQTGDRGYFDGQGSLHISGRMDDMFISGGENISAGEIEHVAGQFGGGATAAVIAVDDEKWGKRPVLFVEGNPDTFDKAGMRAHLEQQLAKMKRPDVIIPLQELPRTGIGKVDYKTLALGWVTGRYSS